MSASIFYQPVVGTCLTIGAPSSFLDLLDRVFHTGRGAFEFQDYHVNDLRAAARATDQTQFRVALNEIADAVEKHGAVRVWPEY